MWRRFAGIVIMFSHVGRAAEPGGFAAAVSEAKRAGETPAGNKYELALFPSIAQTVADAVRTCGGNTKQPYQFDIVFIISADGHIRRVLYPPNQPSAACIAKRFQGKAVLRPPGDSWPVGAQFNNK
jgi:hypothetical protein